MQLDERKTIKNPTGIFAMDAPGVCGWRDSAFSGDFNGSMTWFAQRPDCDGQRVFSRRGLSLRCWFVPHSVLCCSRLFRRWSIIPTISPARTSSSAMAVRTPIRLPGGMGALSKPGHGSADPANGAAIQRGNGQPGVSTVEPGADYHRRACARKGGEAAHPGCRVCSRYVSLLPAFISISSARASPTRCPTCSKAG
jgi:hypothetical protein